jgi:hypothetical protein
MNPRYPVYVISKGRWEKRVTVRYLDRMAVPYRIVVEPQEYASYAAVIDPRKILILPFSNLGQGSIPARNWVWDHAKSEGHKRHWILDDNIEGFYRYNGNAKRLVLTGAMFKAAEDFTDRYVNVPLSGFQYESLIPRRSKRPPFTLNTRVYSCILIDNACPHRWRGRYNEDTDLSLRVLKDGDCTILFNAFLANKAVTMRYRGGNTEQLYVLTDGRDGRLEMARSLQRQHPDVVKIVRKWGRWQHQVDYRPFRGNKLIRRPGIEVPEGVDNYGMRLSRVKP